MGMGCPGDAWRWQSAPILDCGVEVDPIGRLRQVFADQLNASHPFAYQAQLNQCFVWRPCRHSQPGVLVSLLQ